MSISPDREAKLLPRPFHNGRSVFKSIKAWILAYLDLFLALAGSVVSSALGLVGVTTAAAGVKGVGAACGVLGSALGLVGVAGAAAGVELVLALGVGGSQSEGSEGQGEDGGDADHFG